MVNIKKKVLIEYFALLREERGLSSEEYSTDASDAEQLYNELKNIFGLSLIPNMMRVAINDRFVSWDTIIKENDKIIFIPPTCGG